MAANPQDATQKLRIGPGRKPRRHDGETQVLLRGFGREGIVDDIEDVADADAGQPRPQCSSDLASPCKARLTNDLPQSSKQPAASLI